MADLSDQMTQQLRAADADVQRLKDELASARQRLADLIVAALQTEAAPSEVGRHVSYDRNHIRRIAEAAGLPPRPKGGGKRKAT